MEELLLGAFLALQELDVVHQEDVDVPVAALERHFTVVTQAVDEVVGELFGGYVTDPHARKESLCVVASRVQQVCLTQPGLTPDEQGVVSPRRRLGHGNGRGVGEAVGGANDEGVEGVLRVEPRLRGLGGGRAGGRVGRPDLVNGRQRVPLLVHLVGVVLDGLSVSRLHNGLPVRGRAGAAIGNRDAFGGLVDLDGQGDGNPEVAAEGVGYRIPQAPFDGLLGERGRRGEQGEAVDQGDGTGQTQPGPLLSGEHGCVGRSGCAELGDNVVPDAVEPSWFVHHLVISSRAGPDVVSAAP